MGDLPESDLEKRDERASLIFFGRVVHLGEILAFAKSSQEPLRLAEGRFDRFSLVKDDRPGEDGEKEEDEEDKLDNRTRFGDVP